MPKKKEVEVEKVVERVEELNVDFGRADLNELASKLNEVIRKVNG